MYTRFYDKTKIKQTKQKRNKKTEMSIVIAILFTYGCIKTIWDVIFDKKDLT